MRLESEYECGLDNDNTGDCSALQSTLGGYCEVRLDQSTSVRSSTREGHIDFLVTAQPWHNPGTRPTSAYNTEHLENACLSREGTLGQAFAFCYSYLYTSQVVEYILTSPSSVSENEVDPSDEHLAKRVIPLEA